MPNSASDKKLTSNIRYRRIIVIGLLLVVAVLSLSNLIMSAKLSHVGIALTDLNQQSDQIKLEISRLEGQINKHSSLVSMREKAQQFGFVTEYQAIVLPKTLPVAYHSQ